MDRKLTEEYEKATLTMTISKCEYLLMDNEEVKDLDLEDTIKGMEKSKYLWVILNKQGNSRGEMQDIIHKKWLVARTLTGQENNEKHGKT